VILRARIVFLCVGVILFGLALRSGSELLRWIGIGCVAAALLLRFAPRGR
jgi:hypothetical protein